MFSIFTFMSLMAKKLLFMTGCLKNNHFPQPLSKTNESYYIKKHLEGCLDARAKLIEHNLRLVAHIAKKYDVDHLHREDLISIGTVGLIKGVDSYQLSKGNKLSTYIARCIDNEILMFLRSLKKSNKDISLYSPIGHDQEGNEITLNDVIKNKDIPIEDWLNMKSNRKIIQKLLLTLNERERFIIEHRFHLNNKERLTQKEIAQHFQISRSYVSRIEKKALITLLRRYNKKNTP
ncbi:MAG TPA: RNA polymerase sporulation sigma factor SigK [Pseudogracilibacillus sp.]|nr:RNA polymerase sporulation sigma factor SigK [Pseudogracilibacillus sp.]